MTGNTADNSQGEIKAQPWKKVWPPVEGVAPSNAALPEGLSNEELTNQRAFGSHASNTKGRIVHIKSTCK